MQVGSFYEAYSTNKRGPDLSIISSTINVACTRKDKSINIIDEKNPLMLGFPLVATQKFIDLLVNNGYTIVVIDQVTPPPNPKREITNIYSSGTYIENSYLPDTNFILCIYLEKEKQRNSSNKLLCSGMSAIDLTTSKTYIYEAYSNNNDCNFAADETIRFINSINPTEIIIYYNKNDKEIENKVIPYLELDNKNFKINTNIDKKYIKLNYQNDFLNKIYKNNTSLSCVEYLDLDRLNYARLSFIILLDYAYEHNNNIIKGLSNPIHYLNNNHLILGNNAIQQLNIIENYNNNIVQKFKCLFDVVNNTSTPMGKRYLRDRLVTPLICHKKINEIYKHNEQFYKNSWKMGKKIEKILVNIKDIERLNRKIFLKILKPYELFTLYESLKEVKPIYNILIKNKKLISILPKKDIIHKIDKFIKDIEKIFIISELKKFALNNITTSFFNTGIYKDIDELFNNLKIGTDFMDKLAIKLTEYINDNNKNTKRKPIQVKKNNTDKYYLSLSKVRAKILKENIKYIDEINIDGYNISINDLIFNENNKNITKITIPSLVDKTGDISNNEELLIKLVHEHYIKLLDKYSNKYYDIFKEICNFISYVDFIKSNSKTAILYNYKKPIIEYNNKTSYIKAKQLRHPIIERIIDYEYVPHDIDIGTNLKGILLHGPNSAGKSSLMKTIGLTLIMAQSGLYVPAQNFVFSPYTSLYTRIAGDDNIFKGLSSFALEMVELNAILKRAGPNTLVIGDEVCKGTENISGNSIVASTIIYLNKSEASFIFATHLHEVANLDKIKKLDKVKSFHLSVNYDSKTDTLIYDRCLKPGQGDSVYGITFARYIINNNEFIKQATEIKNDLLKQYNTIISGKTSRYNSDVLVDDCQICGKTDLKLHISPLETHHIQFQKDCINEFSKNKPHIKKNSKANLIVLCNECHDKIHNNTFSVEGYVMTSKGKSIKLNINNQDKIINNKNKLKIK
jgi:DNA mismatch repair protein MutS